MEHTPGPWKIEERVSQGIFIIAESIPDDYDKTICCMRWTSPLVPKDVEMVDARLIAAAPELLAMLKTTHDVIASLDINVFGSGNDGEIQWPIRDELLDKIAKAIAKATEE